MKIWKEFGSSHSGNVTVIGEFDSEDKASNALQVLEDFAKASWEERYPNAKAFREAWKTRIPNIEYMGPNDDDFETGIDNDPDVFQEGNKVIVTHFRSENVSGFVKILFRLGMKEITISGQGA